MCALPTAAESADYGLCSPGLSEPAVAQICPCLEDYGDGQYGERHIKGRHVEQGGGEGDEEQAGQEDVQYDAAALVMEIAVALVRFLLWTILVMT